MLDVLAISELMKIAPKARVAAGTGVEVAADGSVNDRSIELSLNIANVFIGLNAGKRPAAFGLTVAKPLPLTAYTCSKKTPRDWNRLSGMPTVLPGAITV